MVYVRALRSDAVWASYWQRPPTEYDGFNTKTGSRRLWFGLSHLLINNCDDENPCPGIVTLYAKLGLHRYNLLNGTNFKLIRVQRYNYVVPRAASTYYITMLAKNPDNSEELVFQTKVNEHSYGTICFSVFVARPLQDESDPNKRTAGFFSPENLPEWPPRSPFCQFKLLKESELQCNNWIQLYLELSVATTHRGLSNDHNLSDLKILKVAIDTTEEALNAKKATVYIHYKDPCKDRVGKDADRVAIVRRNFVEQTGLFSLEGQDQSSEGVNIMMPEEMGQSLEGVILMPEEKSQNQRSEGINMMPEEKSKSQRSVGIVIPEEKGQILADIVTLEEKGQSSAGIVMPEEKGQSSAGIVMPEEKGKKQRAKLSRTCKFWRLSGPMWHNAYNRGLARRLHKRRSIRRSGSDDKHSVYNRGLVRSLQE